MNRKSLIGLWLLVVAFAALTGAGRIEGRKHHLSDVVMGATVGLLVGSTVGRDTPRTSRLSWQPMQRATGLQLQYRFG